MIVYYDESSPCGPKQMKALQEYIDSRDTQMIEVMQTDVTHKSGNCIQACVASILNIDITGLPDFRKTYPDAPMRAVCEWASQRHMAVIEIKPGGLRMASEGLYCIVAVHSKTYRRKFHAVVGEINRRGNVIMRHDPSPIKRRKKGTRIDDWLRLYFLIQR